MFITSKTVEAHKAYLKQHTTSYARELYPYQLMIVEAMHQMEHGKNAPPAEMFFCGPRGSSTARVEALTKGKKLERNIVRTIPHAGILASRTGTGKTACIIELLSRPQKPPTNMGVRQTCLGQVELQQIFVPVDICVVPGNIFSQWRTELELLGQTGYWKFVATTADVEAIVDIFNTYRVDQNVPIQPHILISDTMYERLLRAQFVIADEEKIIGLSEKDFENSDDDEEEHEENDDELGDLETQEAEMESEDFNYRSFPHMFRVRRLVIDECDSLNFKMLWADFIWYVSATFKSFLQKCIRGGTGKNTHSLLGELKQGSYIYSAYQLRKLFCIAISKKVFEDTLAPDELPDFRGRSVMYECPPGEFTSRRNSINSWNHVSKFVYKISESLARGSFAVAFYDSNDSAFVERMRDDFEQKSDDRVSYMLINNTKAYTSKRIQQILAATQQYEIRPDEPTIIFVINAQFHAQGLNLQQAKCAIIINDMSESQLVQIVGRVQRRGRKSQLTIYRIWAPDERLVYPPFENEFRDTYNEIKQLMACKKWRIETDQAVRKIYDSVYMKMFTAYENIERKTPPPPPPPPLQTFSNKRTIENDASAAKRIKLVNNDLNLSEDDEE